MHSGEKRVATGLRVPVSTLVSPQVCPTNTVGAILKSGDDERGVSGVRVHRILKRIGEQPTREKGRDILRRIDERDQIQIRIAVLARGEQERVLHCRTDREPAHPTCVLGCTVCGVGALLRARVCALVATDRAFREWLCVYALCALKMMSLCKRRATALLPT